MGNFSMANEPSFHIPYLYNLAGQPRKTQKLVRKTLEGILKAAARRRLSF